LKKTNLINVGSAFVLYAWNVSSNDFHHLQKWKRCVGASLILAPSIFLAPLSVPPVSPVEVKQKMFVEIFILHFVISNLLGRIKA
jgi:hypothetical protein